MSLHHHELPKNDSLDIPHTALSRLFRKTLLHFKTFSYISYVYENIEIRNTFLWLPYLFIARFTDFDNTGVDGDAHIASQWYPSNRRVRNIVTKAFCHDDRILNKGLGNHQLMYRMSFPVRIHASLAQAFFFVKRDTPKSTNTNVP